MAGGVWLDVRDDVVVLLSVGQRELAGAVVVGLRPLGANHRQGVAEPRPELSLAPLEDDVVGEELADGGVGQGAVLGPDQDEDQFYVFISAGLHQARLVISPGPLGSQVII